MNIQTMKAKPYFLLATMVVASILFTTSGYGQGWEFIYQDTVEYGHSICKTTDGCYMVTASWNWNYPQYGNTLKLDSLGTLLWVKPYGGWRIEPLQDSGFIIAGSCQNDASADACLRKLDRYGNAIWCKTFDGGADEEFHSVIEAPDLGYVAVGFSKTLNASMVYIVKTDSAGNFQWQKLMTMIPGGNNYAYDIIRIGSYYFISGYSYIFMAPPEKLVVIKLDLGGNLVYQKGYTAYNHGLSIALASDTSFIIAGGQSLTKIGVSGDSLWSAYYNFYAWHIKQTPDHGFIIGVSYSANLLAKIY